MLKRWYYEKNLEPINLKIQVDKSKGASEPIDSISTENGTDKTTQSIDLKNEVDNSICMENHTDKSKCVKDQDSIVLTIFSAQ